MSDLSIPEMQLIEPALSFAEDLKQSYPKVRFTCGRRTKEVQALDMAKNVVGGGGRKWIEATYVSTVGSRACQAWVDAHPEVLDVDGIAEGLLGVLLTLTDDEYFDVTHHGTGLALDIAPFSCPRSLISALVERYGGKVLWTEGKLPRWHVEFKHGGPSCCM